MHPETKTRIEECAKKWKGEKLLELLQNARVFLEINGVEHFTSVDHAARGKKVACGIFWEPYHPAHIPDAQFIAYNKRLSFEVTRRNKTIRILLHPNPFGPHGKGKEQELVIPVVKVDGLESYYTDDTEADNARHMKWDVENYHPEIVKDDEIVEDDAISDEDFIPF
jgi:hypothetical protein